MTKNTQIEFAEMMEVETLRRALAESQAHEKQTTSNKNIDGA